MVVVRERAGAKPVQAGPVVGCACPLLSPRDMDIIFLRMPDFRVFSGGGSPCYPHSLSLSDPRFSTKDD